MHLIVFITVATILLILIAVIKQKKEIEKELDRKKEFLKKLEEL